MRTPGKLPAVWRKRKGKKGPYTGNYICKVNGTEVNLGTAILDGEDGALARVVQALGGRRNFKTDAQAAAAATESAPAPLLPLSPVPAAAAADPVVPPPPPPAPPAAASPPPPAPIAPDVVLPPPRLLPPMSEAAAEAEATSAAAAETAGNADAGDDQGAGAPTPDVNLDELAELAVGAQVWCAAEYARRKVWREFQTPELPEQATKKLAEQWKKIAEYGGLSAFLPPWVTGLLIPGAVLVTSTVAMARGFAAAAAEQKQKPAAAGVEQPLREAA